MNIAVMWVLLGLGLLISEMLSGTFVLIFFSIGAFFAALVALLAPEMVSLQVIIDAAVSFAGVFLFRKKLQNKLMKSGSHNLDLGKEIIVDQEIEPHQQARISYQGTTWQASNVGTETIHAGERVTIVGMDQLTLLVKKN